MALKVKCICDSYSCVSFGMGRSLYYIVRSDRFTRISKGMVVKKSEHLTENQKNKLVNMLEEYRDARN